MTLRNFLAIFGVYNSVNQHQNFYLQPYQSSPFVFLLTLSYNQIDDKLSER